MHALKPQRCSSAWGHRAATPKLFMAFLLSPEQMLQGQSKRGRQLKGETDGQQLRRAMEPSTTAVSPWRGRQLPFMHGRLTEGTETLARILEKFRFSLR